MSAENINLQLSDIILIEAFEDDSLNDKTFVIKYLDATRVVIVNIENLDEKTINIKEDGDLDSSISAISLLSRDTEKGYSRQNDLLPTKWIDIFFGGDLPTTITGMITNLEEDMIEIKTFPEEETIYIDFAYKGIPLDIPITSINIRSAPEKQNPKPSPESITEDQDIISPEEIGISDNEVKDQIKELLISADEIQFGPEMEGITQVIHVDKDKQRFGIENQTNDLLDELLASIPNSQRTKSVLNNLHIITDIKISKMIINAAKNN